MTCRARVQTKGVQQGVLLAGVLGAALLLASMGRPDVQEVSFQHFRTHLLANGLVDHIEVTNKSTAKVFVRPGSQRCACRAGLAHIPALLQSSVSTHAARTLHGWFAGWPGEGQLAEARVAGTQLLRVSLLVDVPSLRRRDFAVALNLLEVKASGKRTLTGRAFWALDFPD